MAWTPVTVDTKAWFEAWFIIGWFSNVWLPVSTGTGNWTPVATGT